MAMSDERVDTTIDEVVRELTAGEPGSAFTARVLARIDAGEAGKRTRATWRAAWVMSPLALAVAMVVAVAVFRSESTKPVQQPQPAAGVENKATVAPESTGPQPAQPRASCRPPEAQACCFRPASPSEARGIGHRRARAGAAADVGSITLHELEPPTQSISNSASIRADRGMRHSATITKETVHDYQSRCSPPAIVVTCTGSALASACDRRPPRSPRAGISPIDRIEAPLAAPPGGAGSQHIKVEMTIRISAGGSAIKKTVAVVTGDAMTGFIRSAGSYWNIREVTPSTSIGPQAAVGRKIRLRLNLQSTAGQPRRADRDTPKPAHC
jgi:hypothetical protein